LSLPAVFFFPLILNVHWFASVMKTRSILLSSVVSSLALSWSAMAQAQSQAQELAPAQAAASAPAPQPWTYKTKQLNRFQVDSLLGNPKKLLIIDVRRPDELTKNGSFAVYLNVQIKDLPYALDYIPKDRQILTVSNRAHRAGAAGDLLASNGFKVAGAIGTEDYKEAGGYILKIRPPASASAPAPVSRSASN
jgi:rhodanese-related sulfurtransferase